MADSSISQLPPADALVGNELTAIVQAGTTKNDTLSSIGAYITDGVPTTVLVSDNDAKLALTGLDSGQQVEITDEGKRLERYVGDGARSATQDFTTVEVTAAGNDANGDPYAGLYHWDASIDSFIGPGGQYIQHNATQWQHFDVGWSPVYIDAVAGAASVHPADADWSSTIFDGEIFARPIATERNWHTIKNTIYATMSDVEGSGPFVVNGVTIPVNTSGTGIGWVPVGEAILSNVDVSCFITHINSVPVNDGGGVRSDRSSTITFGDSFPSGALVKFSAN